VESRAAEPERAPLSLAVIVPDLGRLGGAERLALECVRRWQQRHEVTLYSRRFDEPTLADHGIGRGVARRTLSSQLQPAGRGLGGLEQRVLDAVLLPRIWSQELGDHDVYLGHQWPCHLIERRPLVWYAHELFRFAYDLRRELPAPGVARELADLLPSPTLPAGPTALRADLRRETAHGLLRELDRRARPDRVVANSRATAQQLSAALGREDVHVVYPGVDAARFLEPRWTEAPFFLTVGSLGTHKRHRLALEAISLLEGARLVVVGRGPEQRALERMAAVLGVADRVQIRNDVSDDELVRLYAACRAVLFTPVREPFGMVALEALAAGKPLVAVDQGGFTEVVDASCAALVPAEPEALAGALAALLANPADAARMGEAGHKLARAFSWDRTAGELESLLLECRRRQPARATPGERAPASWIGVRLLGEFGDGAAEGAWRRLARDAASDAPRAGHYASHHETTLLRQLAEIERCGFDFVCPTLPLNDSELTPRSVTTLLHLLALLAERGAGLRAAVELVLDHPTPALLAGALAWLARVLGPRDDVVRIDGRPLVVLNTILHPSPGPLPACDDLALRLAPAAEGVEADGGLRWIDARDDETLARGLHAARARGAGHELLLVSSWNDYRTGDHLEPSRRQGERRFERARELIAALRER